MAKKFFVRHKKKHFKRFQPDFVTALALFLCRDHVVICSQEKKARPCFLSLLLDYLLSLKAVIIM